MSEEHKKNHKLAMQKFCGENNPSKRPEVRKKISEAKMGHEGYKYWLGKERDKETKTKISISKKGTIPWNKNKKMSKEHNKKMSIIHQELLEKGFKPNYIHGKCREIKNGKPYSHFVWFSQSENLPYLPRGFVIHHRDLNPHNNEINNLMMIQRGDHTGMHRQISKFIKQGGS